MYERSEKFTSLALYCGKQHFLNNNLNSKFILRATKLLGQGYVKERLKSSFGKLYGRYLDQFEIKHYEVSLSWL